MTTAEEAMLRVAIAAGDALIVKRNALAAALNESATAFHRGMKHAGYNWRAGCVEPECLKARLALDANAPAKGAS